jgi:hypothetical protein
MRFLVELQLDASQTADDDGAAEFVADQLTRLARTLLEDEGWPASEWTDGEPIDLLDAHGRQVGAAVFTEDAVAGARHSRI